MTRTHPRGIALLLCSLLAVTACTPDEPAPEEPAGTAAATEAPVDTEVGPATAPGRATMTEDAAARRLVPVSCGDLPRAPTEQEEDWLVEPGPYSGDAFDQTAAVAGVRAQSARTDQEYADAVIPLIQGAYAEHICEMIRFTPTSGTRRQPLPRGAPRSSRSARTTSRSCWTRAVPWRRMPGEPPGWRQPRMR